MTNRRKFIATIAAAIAVPPGMESSRPQPYDVLLVKPDGTTTVYQTYR
jgi:hypothetical protein